MTLVIEIITPDLLARYIDGDLKEKDMRLVENAIANDERAKKYALHLLWEKSGFPVDVIEKRSNDSLGEASENTKRTAHQSQG